MMINAINVPVAFQMICHTRTMSPTCTTPLNSASNAPSVALQPTPRPLGCQITSVMVSRKINDARSMRNSLGRRIEKRKLEYSVKRADQLPISRGRLIPLWGKAYLTVEARLTRSEEHTSELQSLMRNSYAVFCLK